MNVKSTDGILLLHSHDYPRFTRAEEAALARKSKVRNCRTGKLTKTAMVARNQLVSSCIPYAAEIASRMVRKNSAMSGSADLRDVISEAMCALIHAVELFDPAKRTRLTTYVTVSVLRKLQRWISQNSHVVYLPAVPVPELADRVWEGVIALKERVQDNKINQLGVEDAELAAVDDTDEQVVLTAVAATWIAQLPARTRQMLRMKYSGTKLQDIGVAFGITKSRAGQILCSAMRVLREKADKYEQGKRK